MQCANHVGATDPSAVQAECLVYVTNESSAALSSAGHHLSFAGTPTACVSAGVEATAGTVATTLATQQCA